MIAGLAILLLTPCAVAQVAPPEKEKPTTQSYLVADLLKKGPQLNWGQSGKTGRTPLEELVRLVQTSTGVKNWSGPRAVASLEVMQGEKLQITAPPKMHDEIKDLLAAVRRLAAITVRIDSELYEVDRDYFSKNVEPELIFGKGPKEQQVVVPFKEDGEKALRKQKTLVNATKELGNGGRDSYFSVTRSILYKARPSWLAPDDEHETALHGLTLSTRAIVSGDRRFITLDVEMRQRDLVEMHKETVTNPSTCKEETIERPEIVETRRLATLKVDDGLWLATVLSAAKKDRVRLLLIQPTIIIPEEEREKKVNP